MRALTICTFILSLLLAPLAEARGTKYDGRWARGKVIKKHKALDLTRNVRVTKLRYSKSGKSSQVAVANKYGGKVRLYNVNHKTGLVSATRTGLISQARASLKANKATRRQNGTFAGIRKQGLSKSGKSYKYRSQTSKQRRFVNLKTGNVLRFK